MAISATAEFLENEEEIVSRAKNSEEDFSILYRYYLPKIYGYVYKRTGNQQVAEDLVSQIFLKAFVNIGNYQPRGYRFGSWLYKIATNALIDYYRKNKHQEIDLENAYELASPQNFSENFDHNKQKENVHQILTKLPMRYQEVLHLKFFAEMEYEEIAKSLNLSVNNARVLVFRSLKKFDQEYKKYVK